MGLRCCPIGRAAPVALGVKVASLRADGATMKGRSLQLLLFAIACGIVVVRMATAGAADACGPGNEGEVRDGGVLCAHGNDEPPAGVDTTEPVSTNELFLARF